MLETIIKGLEVKNDKFIDKIDLLQHEYKACEAREHIANEKLKDFKLQQQYQIANNNNHHNHDHNNNNQTNEFLSYLCKSLVKTNMNLENDLSAIHSRAGKRQSPMKYFKKSSYKYKPNIKSFYNPSKTSNDVDPNNVRQAAELNQKLVEKYQKIVQVLEDEVKEKDKQLNRYRR